MRIERLLWGQGVQVVAGIDEAGRGAWAGPVVAAAVVLPPDSKVLASLAAPSKRARDKGFVGVRDSKKLSPRQRTVAVEVIRGVACGIGVGIVPPIIVDELGLSFAGQLAFWRAVRGLQLVPNYLLVDGFPLWSSRFAQSAVLQGDGRCLSIAAASIVAKTTRDAIMAELDVELPGYGFAHNVGYGTAEHGDALRALGPTPHHRRTWQPVAAICGSTVVQTVSADEEEW
jgi:ribonuclease HII